VLGAINGTAALMHGRERSRRPARPTGVTAGLFLPLGPFQPAAHGLHGFRNLPQQKTDPIDELQVPAGRRLVSPPTENGPANRNNLDNAVT